MEKVDNQMHIFVVHDIDLINIKHQPIRANAGHLRQQFRFGKKIGSVDDNRVIYPRLLTEWERVVKAGGRLVVMTYDKRSWGES
ncbi:hypothetical protein KIN20_006792 [Parelaphostrongylus tenuis]|uniref:Uncharacterized protein n=1 Tax=Parelaphostrongylus tenuis TaxID=148309 RepID=A0AAD5MN36_PARTN|nr:hypothetical protein KIN20_006792 [Parelaphostrongylus tenuis]